MYKITTKIVLRGNFIALNVYFREGFKNNDLVSTKKFLEKVELTKTKIKSRKSRTN